MAEVVAGSALRLSDRTMVHRKADKITSAEMIALFHDLEALHPTATVVGVVLDNARYNHSKEIKAHLAGYCDRRRTRLPRGNLALLAR